MASSMLSVTSRLSSRGQKWSLLATRSFASVGPNGAQHRNHQNNKGSAATFAAAAFFGLASAGVVTALDAHHQKRPTQKYPSPPPNPIHAKESHQSDYNDPPPRPDLPIIPLEEVAEHSDEDSLWYTFRGGVYDLTFFLNGHPGGTPRLLMAAGQDLEPYWEVYRQHLRGHVTAWMEKHRIGSLSPEDAQKVKDEAMQFGDMYDYLN